MAMKRIEVTWTRKDGSVHTKEYATNEGTGNNFFVWDKRGHYSQMCCAGGLTSLKRMKKTIREAVAVEELLNDHIRFTSELGRLSYRLISKDWEE